MARVARSGRRARRYGLWCARGMPACSGSGSGSGAVL